MIFPGIGKLAENLQSVWDNKDFMEKFSKAYERLAGWANEFEFASIELKKMIISQLTSRIEISRGYKVNIVLNTDYERFCEEWEGLH